MRSRRSRGLVDGSADDLTNTGFGDAAQDGFQRYDKSQRLQVWSIMINSKACHYLE